jgi:hypothetical protein
MLSHHIVALLDRVHLASLFLGACIDWQQIKSIQSSSVLRFDPFVAIPDNMLAAGVCW